MFKGIIKIVAGTPLLFIVNKTDRKQAVRLRAKNKKQSFLDVVKDSIALASGAVY